MTLQAQILLIDDDPYLQRILKAGMVSDDFDLVYASTGNEGMRQAYQIHPDLIILDIRLPDMDGIELCAWLRKVSDVPILMLTASTEEEMLVMSFHAGADDFLTKPFRMKELKLRICALLRRTKSQSWSRFDYDDGVLQIDLKCQEVYLHGKPVHFSPTEFRLLRTLLQNQGNVVAHETLLKEVWGSAYKSATVLLSVYISYLRSKLESTANDEGYIRTRWGVGYWFAPQHAEIPELSF